MSLEDDLRAAVKNGFLQLSLHKVWDGADWMCSYRTTGSTAVHETRDRDPVAALTKALRSGTKEEKTQKPIRREVEDLA